MLLHTLTDHFLQQQSFHQPSFSAPIESYLTNSETSRNQNSMPPLLIMEEAMNLFLQSTSTQNSQRQKRTLEPSFEASYAQRDDTDTNRNVEAPLLISNLASRKKLKVAPVPPPPMRRRQPRPPMQVPPLTGGPIELPGQQDVLCGRGGRVNTHPGNVTLRELVSLRQLEYLSETTKKLEKAYIAAEIVATIRAQFGGRFLRQNPEDQYWYEIGDERAIRKVLQALREHGPQIRPMMAP
jgi:hypothetical protein